MDHPQTIIFLCPHNAAKSVIAAAYWARLAAQRGIAMRATSALNSSLTRWNPTSATAPNGPRAL